jgi:hypothetical protein
MTSPKITLYNDELQVIRALWHFNTRRGEEVYVWRRRRKNYIQVN